MKKILLFIATGLFALVSCKPEKAPYLNLSKAEIAVPAESGTEKFVVEVESSSSWEAKTPVADTWVKLTTTDKTIELQFDNNEDVHPRVSSVTVTSHGETKEVKITQMAAILKLSVENASELSYDENGGDTLISVKTSGKAWVAESDADWCKLTTTEESLTISVPAFNADELRTANVSIKIDGEEHAKFTVKQQGKSIRNFKITVPDSTAMVNSSYVYDVMVGETKVAEICREMIRTYDAGTLVYSKQTTVIYPYADGKIDVTKGFSLRDAQPLSWNVSDTTITYTSSDLKNYAVVYLKDGEFSVTSNEKFLEAQSVPQYMSDVEGNRYGIVKIGFDYWMTSSLRTSKFNDGSEIKYSEIVREWADTAPLYYKTGEKQLDDVTGYYYNYYVVTAPEGIAPKGWLVPSSMNFAQMKKNAGHSNYLRANVKWVDTKNVEIDESKKSNLSGFSAFPAGIYSNTAITEYQKRVHFLTSDKAVKDLLGENCTIFEVRYNNSGNLSKSTRAGYSIRLYKPVIPITQ